MVTIHLITGPLGSGKTSFIRKYAPFLAQKGLKVGVIENDFGAVNVDVLLLQELREVGCEVEQIVACNDKEDWQRRFKAKVIAMNMEGFDVLLVEPSGIYDVEVFLDAISEEPLTSMVTLGNIVTLLDVALFEEKNDWQLLDNNAKNMLISQIAPAGTLLFTKGKKKSEYAERIKSLLKHFRCDRIIEEKDMFFLDEKLLFETDRSDYSDEMLRHIEKAKAMPCSYRKMPLAGENTEVLYFFEITFDAETLLKRVREAFENKELGDIKRIKGFFCCENQWHLINATPSEFLCDKASGGQQVIMILGNCLQKEKIQYFFA